MKHPLSVLCRSTVLSLLCLAAALLAYPAAGVPLQPVLYSQLHSFTNSLPDGNQPLSIALGPDGVIYGVTFGGGTNANPGGTIFKVNRDGSGYVQLHSFDATTTGNSNAVLSVPAMAIPQYGGLTVTLSREGILYGTTWMGGANNQGTVFKLNRDGSGFTTIRDFGPGEAGPITLMQGNDGALYGTTWYSGPSSPDVVFRLTTDGNNYTVLYTFAVTDGFLPVEPLMQAKDGLLYGSLYLGTNANQFGTIFKINPADQNYTVLRHLGSADGFHPTRLIQASDGNLYGTVITGPGASSHGAIFQMDTNGNNFALLHMFTNVLDGSQLHNGVVEGPGNMLYGAAVEGGSATGNLQGTIYQLHVPTGTFNVIYNFSGGQLGAGMQPLGALALGDFSDGGIIFGTATFGGATQGSTGYNGVVFSLVVNPPVSVTPTTTPNSSGPTTIFWPAWAQNYVLQTTTNLTDPNSWTSVNVTNLQVIGVTVTNGAPGAYYRLVYPTF